MKYDNPTDQERHEEANAFAMELLMPTHLLEQDIAANANGVTLDEIAALAKKYQVEPALMAIRIGDFMAGRRAGRGKRRERANG